jgi:hypothetical protein
MKTKASGMNCEIRFFSTLKFHDNYFNGINSKGLEILQYQKYSSWKPCAVELSVDASMLDLTGLLYHAIKSHPGRPQYIVLSSNRFVSIYWHPLKGPCQEENILPSQKRCSFFAGTTPSNRISPFSLPASVISEVIGADPLMICYQAPIRFKAEERKKLDRRLRSEEIFYLVAKQPSFFLCGPWSGNWTPEKHSVPCHVQGVFTKYRVRKAPAIEGS